MVITTTARRSSSSNSSGSFFVALISAVVIVCWIGLSALPFYSVKKHSHHRLPIAQDALLLQSSQEGWSPIITAAAEDDSQSYNNYYNRQLSKHLKQLKQEPSSSSQNQSQQEQQQQSSSSSSQQQQDAISIDYSKFSCDSMNDPDLMSKLQQRLEENERRKEQQQQQSQLQLQKSQSQRQTNKKKKKSEHEKDNSNGDGDGGGGGQEDASAADGILQQSAKKLPTTSTLSSTQPKEELLLLDKCQFAKTCNDGDGVGFGVSLFCSSSSSDNDTSSSTTTTLHNTLTILLLLTLLLLLFRLLNSTTDEFFSPGLEHFSLQLGLPPRFAGVTLLALGNGAPDVAATMNATLDSHEGYLMALGELTGTSMFVSGVIFGVIVSLNDGTSTSSSGSHHDDGGTKEVEGGRKEENNDETKQQQQQQQRKQPTTTMKMGVPCQGPLLRDIAVLILVCVVSMSYLERGIVNYGFVYTLLAMYFMYVLTVLGADAYHLLYHLPRVRRSESGVSLCSSVGGGAMSIEGGLIPSDDKGGQREEDGNVGGGGEQQLVTNEQTPLVVTSADSHHHQHHHHLHHNHSLPVHTHSIRDTVIEAMSNYSCDEEQQQEEKIVIFHPHHAVHPHHENGPMFLQSVFRGGDALKRGSSTSGVGSHSARQTMRKSVSDGITSFNSWSYSDSARDKNEKDGASSSSYQVKRLSSPDRLSAVISSSPPPLNITSRSRDEECAQPSKESQNIEDSSLCDASLQRPNSWEEAWRINVQEFKEHWNDFFVDIYRNDENGALDVILLSIELPFTIIRKLTNPVPCDGYYCRPLVAVSIILSPLWLRYYFNDQFGYDLSATYIGYVFYGSALLVGMIVLRYAPGGDGPMDLYMVVPLTLYGFAIAATWLDSIADKLVELLELFGILLEIPSTIMGLTVLAFGNSLQDLIANVSLSRKGLSTMAVTACLAGPIFNLCIGLGLGFMALLKSEGKDEIHVKFPKNIKTGFYFTLANCVLIVIAGVFVGKGVLGKGYGYLACGLYVVYVVTSLYI